jgi:hypothetical protein
MSTSINKKLLLHLRKTIEGKDHFPIGVLAYFGPDNEKITKVVAVILQTKTSSPCVKSWKTHDFRTDSVVAKEIGQFFLEKSVSEVVMTDGVVGCPHDEGIDFPVGEACPHCPFWAGSQE